MADPVALLCNPAAGGGRAATAVIACFRTVFGVQAPVLTTPAPATTAAGLLDALRTLPARAVLCVAGGDGTLHAAVNLLQAALPDAVWPRLAHVPVGSANDGAGAIAALTGRPHGGSLTDQMRAIAARRAGPGHPADLGCVAGAAGARRLFVNFAAAGSPADWAALSAHPWIAAVKRLSVRAAYGMCDLAVIARRRTAMLAVGLDGAVPAERRSFAWFAVKARYLGGGLDLGATVRLDSGRLHVLAIDAATRGELVRLLRAAKRGQGPAPVAVERARLRLPPPARLNLDGEVVGLDDGDATVEVSVLPGRARWL